jgi:23S rRNA pseudouridine2605 synthase
MAERIQKYLANLGYGSRRTIEAWIKAGRLRIGDRLAKPGDQVSDDDSIYRDGVLLKSPGSVDVPDEVLLYHKPQGQMCSTQDPHFKDYVTDYLPDIDLGRWVMVGRLDINTSGLLLFTTDGQLANQLMHPRYQVTRVYQVKVSGVLDESKRLSMLRSVELEDGSACFSACHILQTQGYQHLIEVRLRSGRYRLVRRLLAHHDLRVSRLKRTAFGCISLPEKLQSGSWKLLDRKQKKQLREAPMAHTRSEDS